VTGILAQDVLRAMEAEDQLMGMSEPASAPSRSSAGAKKPAAATEGYVVVLAKPNSFERWQTHRGLCRVTLKAEERIVVKMSKDGNIESSEVKGELKMMISDVESSYTVSSGPRLTYIHVRKQQSRIPTKGSLAVRLSSSPATPWDVQHFRNRCSKHA
jgi:hypothetical protein